MTRLYVLLYPTRYTPIPGSGSLQPSESVVKTFPSRLNYVRFWQHQLYCSHIICSRTVAKCRVSLHRCTRLSFLITILNGVKYRVFWNDSSDFKVSYHFRNQNKSNVGMSFKCWIIQDCTRFLSRCVQMSNVTTAVTCAAHI